jgi:hypothetical protein
VPRSGRLAAAAIATIPVGTSSHATDWARAAASGACRGARAAWRARAWARARRGRAAAPAQHALGVRQPPRGQVRRDDALLDARELAREARALERAVGRRPVLRLQQPLADLDEDGRRHLVADREQQAAVGGLAREVALRARLLGQLAHEARALLAGDEQRLAEHHEPGLVVLEILEHVLQRAEQVDLVGLLRDAAPQRPLGAKRVSGAGASRFRSPSIATSSRSSGGSCSMMSQNIASARSVLPAFCIALPSRSQVSTRSGACASAFR